MKKLLSILAAVTVATTLILSCSSSTDSGSTPDSLDYSKYKAFVTKQCSGKTVSFGKYEVVRAWYNDVMGEDPSTAFPKTEADGLLRPVDFPSSDAQTHADIAEFCNKLSEAEGLTPYYTINDTTVTIPNSDGNGYRLPTLEEWKFFAHAGKDTQYAGTNGSDTFYYAYKILEPTGDITDGNSGTTSNANAPDSELSKYAWFKYNNSGELKDMSIPRAIWDADNDGAFNANKWPVFLGTDGNYWKANDCGFGGWCNVVANSSGEKWGTHKVGTKLPNEWDIYDMIGNVSELCYNGSGYVYKGGDSASNTSKMTIDNDNEAKFYGFRICRTEE